MPRELQKRCRGRRIKSAEHDMGTRSLYGMPGACVTRHVHSRHGPQACCVLRAGRGTHTRWRNISTGASKMDVTMLENTADPMETTALCAPASMTAT